MSDHREQLVDLSTPPDRAAERGAEVRTWLRSAGWAVAESGLEDWLARGVPADVAGPAATAAVPGLASMTLAVVDTPTSFLAGGHVAPTCPSCGTALAETPDLYSLLDSWVSPATEPRPRCPECGHEDLIGEWDLRDAGAWGAVGVVLDPVGDVDPYEVAAVLLDALRTRFGGRWVHVHLHL